MSIPTLNNALAKAYEPNAPAPTQRLATLQAAKKAGLHVYAAIAPTYPECDYADDTERPSMVCDLESG
jgi:DNA repair photolyase